MHKRSAVLVLLIMCVGVVLSAKADETEPRTARDIVKYCEYKNPGNDQRSHLTIILTDKDGSEKKNVYRVCGKTTRVMMASIPR